MLTSHISKQYKLQQWAEIIQDRKTSGLKVEEWCVQNGLTKHKYYYRLRKVREAMLVAQCTQEIIPVPDVLVKQESTTKVAPTTEGELKIDFANGTIHVNASTPATLLKMTLEVLSNVG